MIRPLRAFNRSKIVLVLACLGCAWLLPTAIATGAESVIHYTDESMSAYEQQLASGQIEKATFNKRVRSLHLLLKNGQYVLIKYPPHDEPTLLAQLQAKHVSVVILKPEEAKKEVSKKPVHHKIRYIVGGVLLVVIIVVATVLIVDRRRKAALD